MNKIIKLSIVFGCFVIGVYFYKNVQSQLIKATRVEVASYISRTLPSMSPTEVVKNFWQFASENRIEELKMFATIEPKSMDKFCEGKDLDDEDYQPSLIREGEYAGLNEILKIEAQMLRINRPGIQQLTITKERIYKDEAIVETIYLNSPTRFYLKKEENGWKIFTTGMMNLDFMKETHFAKERPPCETKSNFEKLEGNKVIPIIK